jgi:hypothetical protein
LRASEFPGSFPILLLAPVLLVSCFPALEVRLCSIKRFAACLRTKAVNLAFRDAPVLFALFVKVEQAELAMLDALGKRNNCTILVLTHDSKATLNNNLYNWSPPTDWRTQVRGKSV